MAKSFKKISVILFVVLLSALLVVGCAFLANTGKVSQSENLDSENDNLTTVASYTLSGTANNMASQWDAACNASKNSGGANVDVIMSSSLNLDSITGTYTHFSGKQLWVKSGVTITLDLNGQALYRSATSGSNVRQAYIEGHLIIKDSKYNHNTAKNLNSVSAMNSSGMGRIYGGNSSAGAGYGCGLAVYSSGRLDMYGGLVYNNKWNSSSSTYMGCAVYAEGGSSVINLFDCVIAYNSSTGRGAGVGAYAGTINIYDAIIRDNTTTQTTSSAGVYSAQNDVDVNIGAGAEIYNNKVGSTIRNLYLISGQNLGILEDLSLGTTKVGVTLAYTGAFTSGYKTHNGTTNPANYFMSDVAGKYAILSGNEVALGNATMIAKPSGTIASKVYTGSTITCANPTGFDSTKMDITGNTGTTVGTYTAKVQPKSGYIWNDGSLGTALSFNWQITRKPVAKPTVGTNILPYTGKVVTYTPAGYSNSQMTISGNTGTAPNEYTATISPNSNHQWSDGTTTAVTIKWRIGTPIAKPTVGTNSFVYNGSSQTYTPANFNSTTMDITGNTGINANTYTASISPKTGYCWNDNTVGAFTLNWSITRKPIDRPTAGTNSFVYNTASRTYQGSGYNSSTMTLSGTSSATNAGTYNITIAPNSNHQWNSGTATETITFPWSITPKPLAKPTLSMTKLEYNSNTLTVPTVGFDSNTMNITGNTGIDAGKKVATITLKDTSNYKWADNTTGSVSLDWEILKKPLEKPTEAVQKTFIYDGTEKTYTPNKIVADGMLLTDNKATEVGTYYAKVNLKPNYQWVGNTEEELSFRFMIVPPGLVVKEGVDYDFIYTDNGTWNQRYTYGDSYQHKMNDQELNQVGGDNVYILGKVQPNTTIAQFLDNIDSDKDFIKIYNNFGELVYDGVNGDTASPVQYIGTSYKVELYVTGESGLEILDEVYISILGDLNADGIVNSADMAMMRRLLNGDINLYSLPLERVLAVYLDNKGGLTSVDQELLNGLVAGRITSNELFEEQELLGEEESYKYIDLVDGRRVQASRESAVIGNVTAGTSISEFVDKVAVFLSVGGASNITLYNNVGELVYKGIEGIQAGHSMQEYVGTGWKVQVNGRDTEYVVSVLGDVTGDGIINAMDVTYLRRIANDNKLLAELEARGNKAVMLAATISNRGGICTADSEILWGTICGTMDLSRYN